VSAGKDGPRDWDKELAEIDKLIASGAADAPPLNAPAKQAPAGRVTGPPAPAARAAAPASDRRARILTWLWFLLAVLLGAGLTQWPYARVCGLPLYGYLGAVGMFGLASIWSTVWSWRTRSAVVHFLSIGLLGWCTFLGAREILPRTGYARRSAAWACPQVAPPPAQAEPAPSTPPASTVPPASSAPSASTAPSTSTAPPAQQ
jgi:hypothetical protein